MTQPAAFETLEDEIYQVCFIEKRYPDGWPRHEACPCCCGTDCSYFFSKHGLKHSICRSCQFVFMNPYPDDATLERIYNAAYYPAVRRFVELPKARAGKFAALFSFPEEVLERIIVEAAKPGPEALGTWLEVGGGIGSFAHLIQTRLPKWGVYLNEMNQDAAAFAREAYGIESLSGSPVEIAATGNRFDVISMIEVLEHTPRPFEIVSTLVPLLRPGGRLVIGVPRFSPLCRAVAKDASASVIAPYHVSHFDEYNLATLLRRVEGLDVDHPVTWQDGPNAFKFVDFVPLWPYWRIVVPTREMETPEQRMIMPCPENVDRWLQVLGVADSRTADLIARIDGKLDLTMIVRRRLS